MTLDDKTKALIGFEAARIRFTEEVLKENTPREDRTSDVRLAEIVKPIDAGADRSIVLEFTATQEYCNHVGWLHGGAAGAFYGMRILLEDIE
ncbi:hypothetical protein NA57DRAFT_78742 [Rhizodiscina lignyota]|uniref:Uncharacterized protein n=1 Tax=Rhizodiscina lignyota TaxID=1504668 RepID=A0A9P4I8K8_9PEZI|nr:hypothetical protein NA57DRAFT_78742 [Rhizodiscina lignyota]